MDQHGQQPSTLSDDPKARERLRHAFDKTARWQKDFKGFTAHLTVNINGKETVIEFKIYRDPARFEKGKKQVAYYAKSISLDECVYLVFVSHIYRELGMKDEVLTIDGVTVRCYVIFYDEIKDF